MIGKAMRIIAVFIFLLPALQALAEVSGSLSCKVKSNKVFVISEGITTEYNGYTDSFEVGDELIFKYSAQSSSSGDGWLTCSLLDNQRGSIRQREDLFFHEHNHNYLYSHPDKIEAGNYVTKIIISEDHFLCAGITGDVILNRYYKSDYEGMAVSKPSMNNLAAQVATFDCRTIENNTQKVIDFFADK